MKYNSIAVILQVPLGHYLDESIYIAIFFMDCMIKEGSIVLPGDIVAMAEELIPGQGTFQDNGAIRSSMIGKFKVDRKKMLAVVEPLTGKPLILEEGNVVICEVKQVMDNLILTNIIHVAGKKRQIARESDAALFIANISDEFVTHPSTKYRIGDILRARIVKVDPLIQISTKGKEFGVIKAFCTNCRKPLIKKDNILECPVCGRKEERKMADDYGTGNIDRVI